MFGRRVDLVRESDLCLLFFLEFYLRILRFSLGIGFKPLTWSLYVAALETTCAFEAGLQDLLFQPRRA